MMDAVSTRRKLIDLRGSVFETLSREARNHGVSLKKYIETVLEEDAARHRPAAPAGVHDAGILGLIGVAKHIVASADPDDDRLQYILSK